MGILARLSEKPFRRAMRVPSQNEYHVREQLLWAIKMVLIVRAKGQIGPMVMMVE